MKPIEIQMVDLRGQYRRIKREVDAQIRQTLDLAAFINGPQVVQFQQELQEFLNVKHVITCANGTDSLQIAMMALDLKPGDEVIVPAFTYVATAEVIALLQLKPVMVDVDPDTFNVTANIIKKAITPKTKAIVPVHLFGQSSDMDPIMELASKHNLYVIEDNAQAIGSVYRSSDGQTRMTGTIGHIGSTSFFPSKNLGCYGDGGALMTNSDDLALKLRMIANHGQSKKYYHKMVGVNSRLDSLQAGILSVKLKRLNQYNKARNKVAKFYDHALRDIPQLQLPKRHRKSTHVFHQYTLKVLDGSRDALQTYLAEQGIPSMVYYPVPLYKQEAFSQFWEAGNELPVTETLCKQVLSLPMHTELKPEALQKIVQTVKEFFS